MMMEDQLQELLSKAGPFPDPGIRACGQRRSVIIELGCSDSRRMALGRVRDGTQDARSDIADKSRPDSCCVFSGG